MLVAREKETEILRSAFQSDKPGFIAVYGRRRVGKTFLVRETFGEDIFFDHSGLANAKTALQLKAFADSLYRTGYKVNRIPADWLEAFGFLREHITRSKKKKKVIFLDELSWMDTARSDFLTALEFFWNGWASGRKDILLVVCASSTSWMINKVIHNKGGLYNRLTSQIHLQPFSLSDCELLCKANKISMNRLSVLQCYMIMGGIPYYWSLLKKGIGLPQNIDSLFFAKDAPLKDEYVYLYASIFKNPGNYMSIVESLGKKKCGLTRNQIADACRTSNSGGLTVRLEELEQCGFIRKYNDFTAKKKGAIYQLTDNFTLFYYHFMKKKSTDEHFWTNNIGRSMLNTWQGLAFERVVMQHIGEIKKALQIGGVISDVHSWKCMTDSDKGIDGAQIDMLLVRKDQIINIFEVKYSESEYAITKKDAENMRNKVASFCAHTKTRFAIHPVLVTTYGLKRNMYSDTVQATVTLNDLFS